jgi:hypothetical protein
MSAGQGGAHQMTGLETTVAGAIPKVVPPAIRGVRKMLDDQHDWQSMMKILEHAMRTAVTTTVPVLKLPKDSVIEEVAKGTLQAARTGSPKSAGRVSAAFRRRPAFMGGHPAQRLRDASPWEAVDQLALWIQVSAQAAGAEALATENYARMAARIFVEEVLTPQADPKSAGFRNRLTKAWLTRADDAAAGARLLKWLQYPVLLTAAAAAAGAIFGLTGPEVLQIAEAVGVTSTALSSGAVLYQRDRDPDNRAKSEAELVQVLGLLEQIGAFVIDLVQLDWDEISRSRPAITRSDSFDAAPAGRARKELPGDLAVLIDDLDTRLLPAARDRAPLLAAHLQRVGDQLRLLQQHRPSFDQLLLQDTVRDVWQTLERVGYKNRVRTPSPFTLPENPRRAIAAKPNPVTSLSAP